MGDATVGGDKFNQCTGASFTVLCKLDHVLVGEADANVEDARSLLGCLGAKINKKTAHDRSEYKKAEGDVFTRGAWCCVRFLYAAHAGSYVRESESEKPEFSLLFLDRLVEPREWFSH